MKALLLLPFVMLISVAAWAQATATPTYEQEFAPGGHLKLELSAGDYTVHGVEGSKIRVFVTARDPDKIKQVKFKPAMAGANGKLTIDGPHNNIEYRIELPARLDLTIRLSAGDLEVRGLEGDKDISMHAGDMNLHVGPARDYGKVDLSVRFGDLDAGPWSVNKGGIARSFHHTQDGKYKLTAHVGAGDLKVTGD